MMEQLRNDKNMSSADQLEAALRDVLGRHSASKWYVTLDGSQLPDLMHTLQRGSLRGVRYVSFIDELSETGDADAAPYLVDLKSAANRDRAIAYTIKTALTSYAVSWIASPLDMLSLAARLGNRMDACLTENIDVLLRFYDSRILSSLQSALDAGQSSNFFNLAHGWWYASRSGELQSCECNFAEEDAFASPLAISQTQETHLTELAFPDAVLEQLLDGQGDLLTSMNRAQQHAFVVRQIAHAKELRLESFTNLLAYCVIALVEGEEFYTRMPWQEKIDAIRTGKALFTELII
jgi:hypothetical protein